MQTRPQDSKPGI